MGWGCHLAVEANQKIFWPIKVSMPYVVISLSQTNICEWLWLGVDVRMQIKKTRVLKTLD